jgi:hypothetical protein
MRYVTKLKTALPEDPKIGHDLSPAQSYSFVIFNDPNIQCCIILAAETVFLNNHLSNIWQQIEFYTVVVSTLPYNPKSQVRIMNPAIMV